MNIHACEDCADYEREKRNAGRYAAQLKEMYVAKDKRVGELERRIEDLETAYRVNLAELIKLQNNSNPHPLTPARLAEPVVYCKGCGQLMSACRCVTGGKPG